MMLPLPRAIKCSRGYLRWKKTKCCLTFSYRFDESYYDVINKLADLLAREGEL